MPITPTSDDCLDRTFRGCPPPAAGSCDEPCHLATFEWIARTLAEHNLAPIGVQNAYLVARTFLPASTTPRYILMSSEGGRQGQVDGCPVITNTATATLVAPGPRPCARIQFVAVDYDAIARLGHFDGDDVGLTIADAHQARLAILCCTRSPATSLRLDQQEQFVGIGMLPGQHHAADGEEVPCGQAIRDDRRKRFPHQVRDIIHCLPIG